MKRLFVALSTLALMLVAAPAGAIHMAQAADLCEPNADPQKYVQVLTNLIDSNDWQGPLCMKACKAALAGCKKEATAIRKCKHAATKAQYKVESLTCQLSGGEKKTCTDSSKAQSKMNLEVWQSEFLMDKSACETSHAFCQAECNI